MPKPKVNGEYGDSLRRHVVFFVVVRVGFLRPDVADVGFVDFLVATLAFFEAGVGSGWAPAAASAAKSLEGTLRFFDVPDGATLRDEVEVVGSGAGPLSVDAADAS